MALPYLLAFTTVVYTGQILISNCQCLYFFSRGQKSWGHDSPVHTLSPHGTPQVMTRLKSWYGGTSALSPLSRISDVHYCTLLPFVP